MKLLTVREVAELLRCEPQAVYKMLKAGQLPAFRLGEKGNGDWRVNMDELEAWMRRGHGTDRKR